VVNTLSPDQIHGIDKGQYQLGAILDLAELFRESSADIPDSAAQMPPAGALSGTTGKGGNGHFETIIEQAEAALTDRRRAESRLRLVTPSRYAPDSEAQSLDTRLGDIADRLARLEQLLEGS